LFTVAERSIAFAALVAGSALWLLVAVLALAASATAAMVGLTFGVEVGVVTGTSLGAAVGLAAGYAGAAMMLLFLAGHAYSGDPVFRLRLPSLSLLALEAGPYAAYGSVLAFFLFEPHVLGWVGHATGSRLDALTTLELSLTFALPPVLLASGTHEQVMRAFWTFARRTQGRSDTDTFRRALESFHASRRRLFACVLSVLTCLMVILVELAVLSGRVHSASQFVFLFGVVGFFVLGLGQFSCLFLLSLGRPSEALRAALAGVAVVTATAAPLTFIDFRLVAPCFAAGAAVFAIQARWGCRRVLARADYHYAATF